MFLSKQLFLFVISNYIFYCASAVDDPAVKEFQPFLEAEVDALILENAKKTQRSFPAPNINEKVSRAPGHFHVSGGSFSSDMGTLRRTGDARMTHTGPQYVLFATFELPEAVIAYKQYDLKKWFKSTRGGITAKITGIGMDLSILLDYSNSPCKTTVKDAKITNFGHIDVKVTNLGKFGKELPDIKKKIEGKWKKPIAPTLQTAVKDTVSKNLEKFNCEELQSLTAFY